MHIEYFCGNHRLLQISHLVLLFRVVCHIRHGDGVAGWNLECLLVVVSEAGCSVCIMFSVQITEAESSISLCPCFVPWDLIQEQTSYDGACFCMFFPCFCFVVHFACVITFILIRPSCFKTDPGRWKCVGEGTWS